MDQANDNIKLEEERKFIEQKKSSLVVKVLSQKGIESPPKKPAQEVNNLLDEEPVVSNKVA
jgi:hypothetical protein